MRPLQVIVVLALAVGTLPATAKDPASPPRPPEAPNSPSGEVPFVSEGEVVYRGSAAYDSTRVRGPNVNMALTREGRWGGNLLSKDVLLQATPDRISGARDAKAISVEGLISGIRVRVKATRDSFVGRVGDRQVECTRSPDGIWFLSGGASRIAAIRFKGTADRLPDVPMPQWIFAVIGAI
jgi:hypothetical protein